MKIIRSRKGQHIDMALLLQESLMTYLPSHKPEDFDSLSDVEEDGLKVFNEEILSDSDIESSDESDIDDDNYVADNDDGDDSEDDDDFTINHAIESEGHGDVMMLD